MVEISPEFVKAQEATNKFVEKPTNEELLELYALYKVGNGEDVTKQKPASLLDVKKKYKLQAWKDLVARGISTPEKAQQLYVEKVEELNGKYSAEAIEKKKKQAEESK
ncbi:putative fatty acid binding protein [Hypoxylon sp. FL1150]|nr:putative fatty acid binding protein [Hypoxylon sp. FL1150]